MDAERSGGSDGERGELTKSTKVKTYARKIEDRSEYVDKRTSLQICGIESRKIEFWDSID